MSETPVPEMVERVARAMCSAAMIDPDWCGEKLGPNGDQPQWRLKVELAKVAIAAMREPTKPMVDKAWRMIGSNLRYEEVYRHLIDAALERPHPALALAQAEGER